MLEMIVPIGIAAFTGLAALTNRLHNRLFELNRRVDQVELRVAERYVSKADLSEMMSKVESHMERIERKLDRLTFVKPTDQ